MTVVENICPVCKESNEPEAVFCRNCGAALEALSMDSGVMTKETNPQVSRTTQTWAIDETAVPENGIAVYIEGEFKPIHIDSSGEFVIGRRAGTTSNVQDNMLDLAPLGGYGQGVSRRHVVIHRTEQGYEILDLGSVNGTWLNSVRLAPHKYQPLASRSHLRVGSMRLFLLYRPAKQDIHDS